jgi:ribonucleoside-diphosphate reductase alpha chain
MDDKIYWLNKDSRTFLKRGYLLEDETPESRMRDIADGAERLLGITGFADKFERYLHAGYYSLSSPIWSNFARERGLPISCFGSYIPDTMEGIFGKLSEVAMMTKAGGGTSGYFGNIRPRGSAISSGGTSTGAVHFMELYDKTMNVVSQGNVRRGSFAAYLPIDHGDIEEFLQIKGEGNSIQDMSIGVSVSDEWMRSMIDGDKQKRKIWGLVIKKRFESGYPYLFFSDNANKVAPQVYKDKGLTINNSNLCNEIMLSNGPDESFVCNLSSINLERWDELKDTDAIETLVCFLDAVMTEFIDKTEGMSYMEAPRRFAINQRALGIGVLGYHTYLQSKDIPFEVTEPWLAAPALGDEYSPKLVQALGKSIKSRIGTLEIDAEPYGTDAASLCDAFIPAVVFGPGSIAQAHTKDEWIEIEQLKIAEEILCDFVISQSV